MIWESAGWGVCGCWRRGDGKIDRGGEVEGDGVRASIFFDFANVEYSRILMLVFLAWVGAGEEGWRGKWKQNSP